ncbi:MAG: DUF1573 domain-containing protein [Gammaproteobacteria bacterium]|nr:DUF1573 domain-containing protein [Gammaproteobacteria bacterium]
MVSRVVLVGIVAGCMWGCGGSTSTEDTGNKGQAVTADTLTRGQMESLDTRLTFFENTYDFGAVVASNLVTHRFKFANTGANPLLLLQVSASCGCLVTRWPKEPIAPGDSSSLQVVLDTEGRQGPQLKKIYVTSNTPEGQHVLTLRGTVKPQ